MVDGYDDTPRGNRYVRADLTGAWFDDCYLTGARFRNVDLRGTVIRRALLGEPRPWSDLDLPHDDMTDRPGVPRDREARPSLAEVLASAGTGW